MAAPKSLTWPLEPHTAAKHAILRRYLDAWLPILSNGGFQQVLYIDAFAGPGTYSDGEDGSPIIALKAFLDRDPPLGCKAHFHFVELDKKRADHLREMADAILRKRGSSRISITVHNSTFEDAYPTIKRSFGGRLPPTFAFIDPFGWTGLPMAITGDILNHQSCEVMINFMYEEINRFLAHPDQARNFTALFGSDCWRSIVDANDGSREIDLREAYGNELIATAGARYVRTFEMRNKRNATDYHLFFATKNYLGLKKMKEAMWRLDEAGDFSFSDATDHRQMILFDKAPDLSRLEKAILTAFAGSTAKVDDIERFVVEQTAYRETHYKGVLKKLEAENPPKLVVAPTAAKRRRGTFPSGTVIEFA